MCSRNGISCVTLRRTRGQAAAVVTGRCWGGVSQSRGFVVKRRRGGIRSAQHSLHCCAVSDESSARSSKYMEFVSKRAARQADEQDGWSHSRARERGGGETARERVRPGL